MKENNTWQTVYEQLQEFLNECIKLWWRLYWQEDIVKIEIDDEWFIVYWEDGWCPLEMSYHDLFSKDSGIMERVEWKEIYPTVANLQAHYINMCEKTKENKVKYFISNAIIPSQK